MLISMQPLCTSLAPVWHPLDSEMWRRTRLQKRCSPLWWCSLEVGGWGLFTKKEYSITREEKYLNKKPLLYSTNFWFIHLIPSKGNFLWVLCKLKDLFFLFLSITPFSVIFSSHLATSRSSDARHGVWKRYSHSSHILLFTFSCILPELSLFKYTATLSYYESCVIACSIR